MAIAQKSMLHELTVRFRGPLTSFFARRLSGSPDVEDLVNEVLVRLVRHEASLAKVEKIDGYVFTIARNVFRDYQRRPTIRDDFGAVPDNMAEEAAFPADRILIGRETVARLANALEDLPQRTRTIFILYHFEGVPQIEIAHRLFISLSAVEKHMAKANAKIIRKIGPL